MGIATVIIMSEFVATVVIMIILISQALCEELAGHVTGNQAMLEHQQFDLVVRLMNAALQVALSLTDTRVNENDIDNDVQDDSDIDMYGVAAALLPLSTTFGRKLCTGVIQFVYTLIQVILDHRIMIVMVLMTRSFKPPGPRRVAEPAVLGVHLLQRRPEGYQGAVHRPAGPGRQQPTTVVATRTCGCRQPALG